METYIIEYLNKLYRWSFDANGFNLNTRRGCHIESKIPSKEDTYYWGRWGEVKREIKYLFNLSTNEAEEVMLDWLNEAYKEATMVK